MALQDSTNPLQIRICLIKGNP
uniref:Uncharacterized protein n=1 Tax=Arundo donax TaxID=35708 RepID=A0A0A8ZDS0_ARUDO